MARVPLVLVALALGLAAVLAAGHRSLALALSLAALAALVAAAWDADTALAFLFAFLPFRTWVAAISPLPLHFAADAVVFTLAVRVLVRHPRTLLALDAVEVLGLLFAAVGLLATVHAHVRLAGAALELRDLMLFWLLYAAVRRLQAAGEGPSPDLWPRLVPLAVAAVAVIGLQGLGALAFPPLGHLLPGAWQHEAISRVNRGRPYGLVNNPNVFGELALFALVLAYFRARANAFAPLAAFLPLTAFLLAMVLFSYSRTAWLVAFLALAVAFAAARAAGERVGLVLAAVALAAGIAFLPHAHHRAVTVASRSTLRHSARAGRLETLRLAVALVRRRPLGTGLGTFGSGAAHVFHQSAPGVPHRFYADDNYAAILVETGPLGLVLFLLTGLAVLYRIRTAEAPADPRLAAFMLFLALAVIAAAANAWEELELTLYPWATLALLSGRRRPLPSLPARLMAGRA
ncbi:MAG: O-antigen ligase family protein [Firmicutes bacterium]|nr:O-antigen ligase family protein [Bacillota bacterium]